jgi:hypothetical protein
MWKLIQKTAFATLLSLGVSSLASAQLQWTMMAGSGTVNPTSHVTITGDNFVAPKYPETGKSTLTYNMQLPSLMFAHSNTAMAVRFRDGGAGTDWIIVRVKEYNPTTGATYTRIQFNSNSFSSSGDWQEGWITSSFDFDPYKIYYLEAEIYRSSLTPPPPILCSMRLWRY